MATSTKPEIVLAVDPGPAQTAWVVFDGKTPLKHAKENNVDLMVRIDDGFFELVDVVIFEQIASFGMPVGREVFETVFWTGRFFEAIMRTKSNLTNPRVRQVTRMGRMEVKRHLCNSARAKDSNIRAAVLERFGGNLAAAKGTKDKPGPLYGVIADRWAALAIAITWCEQRGREDKREAGWEKKNNPHSEDF